MLKALLEHPLTRGLEIDSPETTRLRLKIVASKPFLRLIYDEWYSAIAQRIPAGRGRVLELGSGAGFLEEYLPDVVRSEIFECPGIDTVLDACHMPIRPASLRAIVMTDVLHHIPDVRRFFHEATLAVRPGGAVIMVEPWVTTWSTLIYKHLHHEPFVPDVTHWEFDASGPLSGANGALPWIVFQRDRAVFEREFPEWTIEEVRPMMPFRYLLSGGVSLRSLMPGWSFGVWRSAEQALEPLMHHLAMFAIISVRRR